MLDGIKLIFKHTADLDTSGVLDEAKYAGEDAEFRRVVEPEVHAIVIEPRPSIGEIPAVQLGARRDVRTTSERIS